MFPSRDEVIDHLERHAIEGGLELQLGTRVDRIADAIEAGSCKPRPGTCKLRR
jgi:hypothetical protein